MGLRTLVYLFTEFIDRPFWSGAYGAISCPAGHQLYEARWLRSPRIARDYSKYWLRTPGAKPRNYSTWLADSVWEVERTHPNMTFTTDLLDDLIANYEGWERRHFCKGGRTVLGRRGMMMGWSSILTVVKHKTFFVCSELSSLL